MRTRLRPPRAAPLLLALLAGCGGIVPPAADPRVKEAPRPVEIPTAPPAGTVGGDGSAIVLNPLTPAEIDGGRLSGELACTFTDADDGLLFFGQGDVGAAEPARGLVKIGGYVEPVAAPGGFEAMRRGARFSGRGTTITIAVTGAAIGGGESPPRPATLTFDRADGARREIAGRWSCGP